MLETALILGAWGFVLSELLVEDGAIFSRVAFFLNTRLPQWIFKPLMGCSKCVAGQWMLWFCVFTCDQLTIEYFFTSIGFIAVAILTAYVLTTTKTVIDDRI